MSRLTNAIERQQAVQRKRTFAWVLFGILAPVSLLFWLEVVFALSHLAEIGTLQLLAELIIALVSTYAAVHAYRSGIQFNNLLANTSQLIDDNTG